MRHIICVTGTMAAGKNVASDILARRGFACLDADVLVHQTLALPVVQERVRAAFGDIAAKRGLALTHADGSIDRRALGALLFADKTLLRQQEAIVHPEVARRISAFIDDHADCDIVLNATVLYKIPALLARCTAIIFIDAPLPLRFLRARHRDGMNTRHILARFRQQRKLFAKYQNAPADIHRVSNTGSLRALERNIDAVLAALALHGTASVPPERG